MRRRWVAEVFVVCMVLSANILFAVLSADGHAAVPGKRAVPAPQEKGPSPAVKAVQRNPTPSRRLVVPSPEAVARLLGWRPPVVAAADAPETALDRPKVVEPKTQPATWLSFVGRVRRDGTGDIWYFKDSRDGRIVSASADKPAAGKAGADYAVVGRNGNTLVLERDKELFMTEVR